MISHQQRLVQHTKARQIILQLAVVIPFVLRNKIRVWLTINPCHLASQLALYSMD